MFFDKIKASGFFLQYPKAITTIIKATEGKDDLLWQKRVGQNLNKDILEILAFNLKWLYALVFKYKNKTKSDWKFFVKHINSLSVENAQYVLRELFEEVERYINQHPDSREYANWVNFLEFIEYD